MQQKRDLSHLGQSISTLKMVHSICYLNNKYCVPFSKFLFYFALKVWLDLKSLLHNHDYGTLKQWLYEDLATTQHSRIVLLFLKLKLVILK